MTKPHAADIAEGPEAFDRFRLAVKTVLKVQEGRTTATTEPKEEKGH